MKQIGRELGDAIFRIKGLPAKLTRGTTVYWQLDYPELARIPWELATTDQLPYQHLLQEGISFVRRVPAAIQDLPAEWPTGRNESLRLLFAWSERAQQEVPHEQHLDALRRISDKYDVRLVAEPIPNVQALTDLCTSQPFHFLHLLAHGVRAANGEFGLLLEKEIAKGEQIARAIVAGGRNPALVTLSACDSANEQDNSFGSVAYQLHVYGIPLVLASQFRMRINVSTTSVERVYLGLLGGGEPLSIVEGLRTQLAPSDNEAWANEVLYSRYRHESLLELSAVAQQQAALRRARVIARSQDLPSNEAIQELEKQYQRLDTLAGSLEKAHGSREDLAETHGLLGSLRRRIAELRGTSPDKEELREALSCYERGFRWNANSHYTGVNVVHLCLLLGESEKAEDVIPVVRFAAQNDIELTGDFWAYASAGELEVYAERPEAAEQHYRDFASAVRRATNGDVPKMIDNLQTSRKQLVRVQTLFPEARFAGVRGAASKAQAVLDSALGRLR